ncbi:hypothetical protein C8R44DRAFT_345485 [Mycena epipterygia]|nr:hypothetical protein C8R44DRAFT_345485 [Mycena epipterygia]
MSSAGKNPREGKDKRDGVRPVLGGLRAARRSLRSRRSPLSYTKIVPLGIPGVSPARGLRRPAGDVLRRVLPPRVLRSLVRSLHLYVDRCPRSISTKTHLKFFAIGAHPSSTGHRRARPRPPHILLHTAAPVHPEAGLTDLPEARRKRDTTPSSEILATPGAFSTDRLLRYSARLLPRMVSSSGSVGVASACCLSVSRVLRPICVFLRPSSFPALAPALPAGTSRPSSCRCAGWCLGPTGD